MSNPRWIALDTETTGLDPAQGHRVIEIGGVEIVHRQVTGKHFHCYLNPDREIDAEALAVHGIISSFLVDKPRFHEIVAPLIDFIQGAELLIHNAGFDTGFLNHELQRLGGSWENLQAYCSITDTLTIARNLHPRQRNNLDALCKRYHIDHSHRELHGALLDAQLLAEVYLAMTSGQATLSLASSEVAATQHQSSPDTTSWVHRQRAALRIIPPSTEELAEHESYLNALEKASGKPPLWRIGNLSSRG